MNHTGKMSPKGLSECGMHIPFLTSLMSLLSGYANTLFCYFHLCFVLSSQNLGIHGRCLVCGNFYAVVTCTCNPRLSFWPMWPHYNAAAKMRVAEAFSSSLDSIQAFSRPSSSLSLSLPLCHLHVRPISARIVSTESNWRTNSCQKF